jgi:N-acetylglucosamine-6-phosphate deacetylase
VVSKNLAANNSQLMQQDVAATQRGSVIVVAKLFDGEQWHHNVQVHVADGTIQAITPADPAKVVQAQLVPGFIDIQVNGGGGALFNSAPTVRALRTMVKAHAQFGSTGLMPTVITDSVDVMAQAADAVAAAIAQGEPGILGIHFEGPHLSVPKRGVHSTSYIRELSQAELAVYARTDIGIKMVTVAPENVSAEQIQQLVALNVRVCLGHSNADGATVSKALAAGG